MKIKSYSVGFLQTNCYFVFDEKTGEAFIIDPGAEPRRLIGEINRYKLRVSGIINTHGHFDHVGGNSVIKKEFNAPVFMNREDCYLLDDPGEGFPPELVQENGYPAAVDRFICEGDVISFGENKLRVINTPGHTPGSICLVYEGKSIFTGDTLFYGSVGRCDLAGGNEAALMKSLGKLKCLPGNTSVFPGHGQKTTISEEINNNPYLKN